MSFWFALFIVCGVFAFGDIVGRVTKAKISSVFVILMGFLVLFMTNLIPTDIVSTARVDGLARWAFQFLLLDMGSSVSLRQLKKEWRTVMCAALAMIAAIVGCIIAIPLVGFEAAMVAAPVANGGIGAVNIMVAAAEQKGLTLAAALGTFMYATQKFVGTVPASRCGLAEGRRIVAALRTRKAADPGYSFYSGDVAAVGEKTAVPFWKKHESYYTQFVCLGIASLFTWLAIVCANLTNGAVNNTLWCMFFGIALRNLGLVPSNFLRDKGNSQGLLNFGALLTVVPSLGMIRPSDLTTLGFQAAILFTLIVICIFIIYWVLPAWKLVGSRELAIGIGMTQFIGFPSTQLIANEIANAVGETQEEKDAVLEKIGTAYVIGGFASVTVLSVFVASFIATAIL